MIAVERLGKSFGPTAALSDVSFSVGPGEIVGFLGRNGAGKTTTMRILAGYFPPSAGTARVAGFDVVEEPERVKARVGYLPENPPLYGEMLVVSYLRFCARLRGVSGRRVDERLAHVIARCGLAEVAGRVIGHLSKGYRQRVGLAQALVHDPDALVLDEPTAALDPGQIHEIRQLVKQLAAEEHAGADGAPTRRAVMLSTHRLEDVLATCSRVIIVSRGRIVADESLAEATRASTLEERFLALTAEEATAAAGAA